MPPGGAGTSRHCSSSGQSGSASQATDAAIQPPAATIAARPTATSTNPALLIGRDLQSCLPPPNAPPPAHRPPPPATATAPALASRRGPECSPLQPAANNAMATANRGKERETVRVARSSISSTD